MARRRSPRYSLLPSSSRRRRPEPSPRSAAHTRRRAPVSCTFVQTYAPAGFAPTAPETGKLVLQAPDRVRFDYDGTEGKVFTFDGTAGRQYVAADRQLVVQAARSRRPRAAPDRLPRVDRRPPRALRRRGDALGKRPRRDRSRRRRSPAALEVRDASCGRRDRRGEAPRPRRLGGQPHDVHVHAEDLRGQAPRLGLRALPSGGHEDPDGVRPWPIPHSTSSPK